MIKPRVFKAQALASTLHAPNRVGLIQPWTFSTYLASNKKPLGFLALTLSLMLGNAAWAKDLQIEGVHYQPEGLVIQVGGGKMNAPIVETWPNEKDGLKTELVIVRMPNCTGDFTQMQSAGQQEISTHPEVKQFWITPINTDKKISSGIQVVLEMLAQPGAPELKPEVLSQGDDQWVITLQSSASKAASPNTLQNIAQTPTSNPASVVTSKNAKDPKNIEAQSLLASLNQAKQRQAELGAQLVATQKALAESQAEQNALQARLNGYENILQDTGINPQEQSVEDRVVIQNLKSALVKVSQKLKAAEEALALQKGSNLNAKAHTATNPTPKEQALTEIPPMAAMSVQEEAKHLGSPPKKSTAVGVTKTTKITQVYSSKSASAPPRMASSASVNYSDLNLLDDSESNNRPTSSKAKRDAREAQLQLALQKNPVTVGNYLNLADYYVAKNEWDKAQATLLNLTHVMPGGALGHYYLAMIYLTQKNQKQAQIALMRYANQNPQDTQGILTLKKAIQANQKGSAPKKPAMATPPPGSTPYGWGY